LGFIKFLLFLQQVLKRQRMHVVELDVFSCIVCHGWGCVIFSLHLKLFTFFDLVLAFQRFTPVSIDCRW